MVEDAYIEIHEERLPMRGRIRTYYWRGNPAGVAVVDRKFWADLEKELPWPVVIIEDEVVWQQYRIARTDGANRLFSIYHSIRHKAKTLKDGFQMRFIVTLMVWGLAYVPENQKPSWRHIGRKNPW